MSRFEYSHCNKRPASNIVSRGDWLGKPAHFKGQNNSAAADVEPTHHVTPTVHSFIQDGGQCSRFVCFGRRLRGNYRNCKGDEDIEEQISVAVGNVEHHEIVCNACGKKYKTRGSYERHKAAKHNREQQQHLSPNLLAMC
ncbi:hypothetical protein ACROYT_G010152 [Oculina patagonica]